MKEPSNASEVEALREQFAAAESRAAAVEASEGWLKKWAAKDAAPQSEVEAAFSKDPPHSKRPLTLVTGTGRAGTTFLMNLFTTLGLPTGFSATEVAKAELTSSHAGLEHAQPARGRDIVKAPEAMTHLDHYVNYHKNHPHEHAYFRWFVVPMRDPHEVAESRSKAPQKRGGYWAGAHNMTQMLEKNNAMLAHMFYYLSNEDQEVITLAFPRDVFDSEYMYRRLKPIMDHYGIGNDTFINAHANVANPNYVSEQP